MKMKVGRRCLHVYNMEDKIVQNEGPVEILFMNLLNISERIRSVQAHPFHLHGHHFQVIYIGYMETVLMRLAPVTNPDMLTCVSTKGHCDTDVHWSDSSWKKYKDTEGMQEPSEKDTVIVPVGGYVVIRFRADNPRWWFLHCHIEPHQLEGMSMVVHERGDPSTST